MLSTAVIRAGLYPCTLPPNKLINHELSWYGLVCLNYNFSLCKTCTSIRMTKDLCESENLYANVCFQSDNVAIYTVKDIHVQYSSRENSVLIIQKNIYDILFIFAIISLSNRFAHLYSSIVIFICSSISVFFMSVFLYL